MAEPSAAATATASGNPALLGSESEEPSERLMNAFVLVFLVVLAFCMILSHQMGHKFKVRRVPHHFRLGGGSVPSII